MKRTKKPVRLIAHPMGGHISYPGKECIRQDKIFVNHGTEWLDRSICHSCEQKPKCSIYEK